MGVSSEVVHKNKVVPKQMIITVKRKLRSLKYCFICLFACWLLFSMSFRTKQSFCHVYFGSLTVP